MQTKNEKLISQLQELIKNEDVSQSTIAKEISISPSAFSQYLNGSYKGDNDSLKEKLTNWLSMRVTRENTAFIMPSYVETATAKRIYTALKYAHAVNCISVVYGSSGVGKSTVVNQYQKDNNNVWSICAAPSCASLSEILFELALELGMDDAPRRKGPLSRVIKRRLKDSGGMVVIDEADHLTYDALEELRIIQEQTNIGMALVGNNRIYTQLTGGRRSEDFARLFSRISKKVEIIKTVKQDVIAIADAWKINGNAERELMQKIANKAGAMRLLSQTLKLAAMLAKGKKEKLSLVFIRAAYQDLEGVS